MCLVSYPQGVLLNYYYYMTSVGPAKSITAGKINGYMPFPRVFGQN